METPLIILTHIRHEQEMYITLFIIRLITFCSWHVCPFLESVLCVGGGICNMLSCITIVLK